MKKYEDIERHCVQIMITGYDLPASRYLSFGIWIVLTEEPLTFTLSCRTQDKNGNSVEVKLHFGIIKLNNTCGAYNKYLQLPEYFSKENFLQICRSNAIVIDLVQYNAV